MPTMTLSRPKRGQSSQTQPQPQPKKQVRFALPTVSSSDRSKTTEKTRRQPETRRERSSTVAPVLVAAGLSAVARSMESKKQSQKSPALRRSHKPPPPPPAPAPTRRETRPSSAKQSTRRPSTRSSRNGDVLGGYDWARVTTKRTYVWL